MQFDYQIEMDEIAHDSKEALSAAFNDLNAEVHFTENNLAVFEEISSWSEALKLHQKLKEFYPGTHPILILIES